MSTGLGGLVWVGGEDKEIVVNGVGEERFDFTVAGVHDGIHGHYGLNATPLEATNDCAFVAVTTASKNNDLATFVRF